MILAACLPVSAEQVCLFSDARYYTAEEYQLVEAVADRLAEEGIAPRLLDADALGRLPEKAEACTLVLVAHEGNAAPDALFDSDGDGEVYDQSMLYTLPYMGIDCLPPTSWWQGPVRRSIPLEWMLTKGVRILWIGEGLPWRISGPGPTVRDIADLDLQRARDEWVTLSGCNIAPHTSDLLSHTSNVTTPEGARVGLLPISAGRGLRLQSLHDLNSEFLSLVEYQPQEGQTLVDAALIRVGAGCLGYLGPCASPSDTATNAALMLTKASWETSWRVPDFEGGFNREGFSFWRAAVGGAPLHRVLLADLASFGESTLLVQPPDSEPRDLLQASSGRLSWKDGSVDLVRNGRLRLCYSVRGTHMNAEESLYQWIRVFTDDGERPQWQCVNYVFPLGPNAVLYAFVLRPLAGSLGEVDFNYQFDFNRPFEVISEGLQTRLLWDEFELLAMPATGNLTRLSAEGRRLALSFKARDVKAPVGFAFVLAPGGRGEPGLDTQLQAVQRFALSHLPEVYRDGLLSLASAEELSRWAFLVLPTPARLRCVTGTRAEDQRDWYKSQPGQAPAFSGEEGQVTVNIQGKWPWSPSVTGERHPDERADLLLVRASEAWHVWSSRDSSYSWARNLERVGTGFRGLGDALLEFDHHWIQESPTLGVMQDWYRLTGDERLREYVARVGDFQAQELQTPCGDYWRRAELYGLASDFCSAGLTGLRNDLVVYEATGDKAALARCKHAVRYVMATSPFDLEARFSRLAHNPLGPEGAFIYRDFPVRAENVAELALQLLHLYKLTGQEEYFTFGKRAMQFLMEENQRSESGGGFCAVWLDANVESGWGVDNWYGLHTTLASLEALREYYVATSELQYRRAAEACREGWLASRLFERDGLLLVGDEGKPWGLEFNWIALARQLFEWAAVTGEADWQRQALRLVSSTYAWCAANDLYDPQTANFAYPEYNGQVPAQSVFHLPKGEGPARIVTSNNKVVELVEELPAGDYVFSGVCASKPARVLVKGAPARQVSGLEEALSETEPCWFWHQGELVVRFLAAVPD